MLIGLRMIDWRYRFDHDAFAIGAFVGVDRYQLATPAYSEYVGLGAQWRNFLPWLPKWDLGLDFRHAQNIARDHVLADGPARLRGRTASTKSTARCFTYRVTFSDRRTGASATHVGLDGFDCGAFSDKPASVALMTWCSNGAPVGAKVGRRSGDTYRRATLQRPAARLVDLSASGAYIKVCADLRLLSRVQIALSLPHRLTHPTPMVAAYVARKGKDGVGVEWCEYAPHGRAGAAALCRGSPARAPGTESGRYFPRANPLDEPKSFARSLRSGAF